MKPLPIVRKLFACILWVSLPAGAIFASPWGEVAGQTSIEQRIEGYLERMTLEEKVGMLVRKDSSWTYSGCERLGIPSFTCHDGPHGVRDSRNEFSTAFPTTVARGAAFDRDLSYRLGIAEGREFRAQGWNMRLGNCVDLNRHPLYGRASESAGEDPYLCAEIGVANVQGTQKAGCIANLKHWVLNTREDPEIRKDNNAIIDERSLIEMYAYPFKEAIQRANAWSVMTAHSRVNGLRSSESPYVLTTVLRDYLGFRYFVLNDWSSVNDTLRGEGVAVADVFNAGHDLETNTTHYKRKLAAEVEDGDVSMERLDEAVGRVLRVLLLSGLVDGQTAANPADKGCSAHVELALEGARKSLVLLKNENGVLPLRKDGSIALVGPNAASLPTDGGGSPLVRPPYTVSVLEGVANVAPGTLIRTARGCDINSGDRSGFPAAVEAARSADAVVFVGGLDQTQEGESQDRKSGSVQLPGVQQELIRELAKVNDKLVVVLISGGVCALNDSIEVIDGLLYSFYGGQEAGQAVAEALFGDLNPGGKLPVTMPKTDDQLPPFTDDHTDHLVKVGYRWFDASAIEPQFAFGHGLSYTTFRYDSLRLSSKETTAEKGLVVEVDVTNTGDLTGDEVVQLYLRDLEAGLLMPKKQLKGFERVTLDPGETKTVRFAIDAEALAFWDIGRKSFFVEEGVFEVMVGGASDKLPLSAVFKITADYVVPRPEAVREVIPVADHILEAQLRARAETLLRVEAESHDDAAETPQLVKVETQEGGKAIIARNADWLCFKDIDMGSWLNFVELCLSAATSRGTIELRLDRPDGKLIGTHMIDPTGSLQTWEVVSLGTSDYRVSGIHDLYIVFRAREGKEHVPVCYLDWWEIEGQRVSLN